MSTVDAFALWRRLDMPGHDACRRLRTATGWRLDGAAIFVESGTAASVRYRVDCDEAWRSTSANISGWFGSREVALDFERRGDTWLLNGSEQVAVRGLVDIDFGFTPATNLFQLRRIALRNGNALDVPVAWFDLSESSLKPLAQRYERRGEFSYGYESPEYGYAEQLEIAPNGFVRTYPKLWELESSL